MVILIIAAGLTAFYLSLILFYTIGWKRVKIFNLSKEEPNTTVSVIIPARNEEENIINCVRSIIVQDYPRELFEIIVVDDHSEDGTMGRLMEMDEPNLKVLSLKKYLQKSADRSFKKQAIEFGIEHAKSDLIVTTDADCMAGSRWLSTIVSFYEEYQPKMITGSVLFSREEGLMQKWQQLDLIGMMGVTAGAIGNGFPNMCNGANLAYEKRVFHEVGGFDGIDHVPTGDDVLLMLKIKKYYPEGIRFLKSHDAVVYTKPESGLNDLLMQRIRWVSKATAFQDKRLSWVLIMAYGFNALILGGFIAGIWSTHYLTMGIAMFGLKLMIELPLLLSTSSFFTKRRLLLYLIPIQFLHIIYTVMVGLLSKIYPYRWKGRKYYGLGKARTLSTS